MASGQHQRDPGRAATAVRIKSPPGSASRGALKIDRLNTHIHTHTAPTPALGTVLPPGARVAFLELEQQWAVRSDKLNYVKVNG